MDALIEFEKLDWENKGVGLRTKEIVQNNQKIRLVEFSEGFVEKEWCNSGHIGYVLKGSMRINFNGKMITYNEGDGLMIREGEEQKHKVIVGSGDQVLLFLVEEDV